MSTFEVEQPADAQLVLASRGYWRASVRRFVRQPVAVGALLLLVALYVVGALAHTLAPGGWNDIYLGTQWQNHPPTLGHGWLRWLGTDNIGRSSIGRTIWGMHYTQQAALLGALIAAGIGIVMGALAATYGGFVDAVIMRFADFATTFPVLITMIAAFALNQPITVTKATLVFAFYLWAFVARVVRTNVRLLGVEEYAEAARALGASDLRVLVRHLLPNAAGAIIVATTSLVGQIVLVEATAEFFGFGVNSLIRPTLGNLIAESAQSGIGHYNFLALGWWTWVTPAIALVLLLVAVNLVGDGLARALDARHAAG
ncbi:MAG TPA: ABC transporter permease [Gaiellaceae bacterium]|nr:ABC transporter permease [Gaiellaceae bacterium]